MVKFFGRLFIGLVVSAIVLFVAFIFLLGVCEFVSRLGGF